MSEMIERVARAIYDEIEGPAGDQDFARQTRQWRLSDNLARAAMEAMTDPCDGMIQAGVSEDQTDEVYRDVRSVYTSMIRAALKEQA